MINFRKRLRGESESRSKEEKKVIVAGFGDTGILTAMALGNKYDILAISPKPAALSGQELGMRLSDPGAWKREYLRKFNQFKRLDGNHLKIVQATVSSVNTSNNTVQVKHADGSTETFAYDALLISSGVSNGFWRTSKIEDWKQINQSISRNAQDITKPETNLIAVVGGGAAGVSTAYNIKKKNKHKQVHFFYSGDLPLPDYHPRTRRVIAKTLRNINVRMHSNHRATVPVEFNFDEMSTFPISFTTGQPDFNADLTIWTIGKVKPNSAFLPCEMVDKNGFVRVDRNLRVLDSKQLLGFHRNVFCVGDVAATNKQRDSARNGGHKVVAHNIDAYLSGRSEKSMKRYTGPREEYRWGSILGVQDNGLWVFFANGLSLRFPRWYTIRVILPINKDIFIYGGVRMQTDSPEEPKSKSNVLETNLISQTESPQKISKFSINST